MNSNRPNPILWKRGAVYRFEFRPPSEPNRVLEKYVVCLQEGKLFEQAEDFVGVLITSLKEHERRKKYPTDVFLTPEESHTEFGAKVICAWIHTIPKSSVTDYAYSLTEATMREIEDRLIIALCMERYEEIEAEQEQGANAE
jgi:mRNA-degrading endonuclease toxin of MazEF toxin-antitoxin module